MQGCFQGILSRRQGGEEEMFCPVLLPGLPVLSIRESTPDWFPVFLMTGKNGNNSEFLLLKQEEV